MKIIDIEFHDCPVKDILFQLKDNELAIFYLNYIEHKDDYDIRKISFKGVKNLTIDAPLILNPIYTSFFDIDEEISEGLKKIKCIFTTGFSSPDMRLFFEFSHAYLDEILLE